ncbi:MULTISPECIES: hypothetical protein [unclassified Frankia]|uniref:hypothetical protein n=1 Tax=unclassified Frankia TaxID=2632575 RepID=UPI001EE3CAC6|nr:MULTISPECIES: hypothetical protein [unclassified Frankia]
MHTAREQRLQAQAGVARNGECWGTASRCVLVEVVEENVELRLPQREARARADMAATLGALEDEAASARVKKLAQQRRRRCVQKRRDANLLELGGLGGPATGDDDARRPDLAHHRELRGTQILGREADQTDAPGPRAQQVTGLGQQLPGVSFVGQRQREERQRAVVGDAAGEPRLVTDPRHRSLRDRPRGRPRGTQRRALGEQRVGRRDGGRICGGVESHADGLNGSPRGLEPSGELGGQESVLANCEQLPLRIFGAQSGDDRLRGPGLDISTRPACRGRLVDPVPGGYHRLGTIDTAQCGAGCLGRRGLVQQA